MDIPREPQDYTPIVGAQTDIAPLGRSGDIPEHEQTAGEDGPQHDWAAIEAAPEFRKLLARKAAFIVPTCVFFVAYYFALPVLVGYFPELMKTRVGSVNIAYLFALSQFFMAWIVAALYVRVAAKWDKAGDELLAKFKSTGVAK